MTQQRNRTLTIESDDMDAEENDKITFPVHLNASSSDGMVNFNVFCHNSTSAEKCQRMVNELSGVGNLITHTFVLKRAIHIHATVEDISDERDGILAWARPTAYYSFETPSFLGLTPAKQSVVVYPQSLAKQIIPSSDARDGYLKYDIKITFNSNAAFHYGQYHHAWWSRFVGRRDFQVVAMHELMHGLGFASSWRPLPIPVTPTMKVDVEKFGQFNPRQKYVMVMAPQMVNITADPDTQQLFQTINIFDYYIATRQSSGKLIFWRDMIPSIEGWMLSDFKDREGFYAAMALYKDVTSDNKVVFAVPEDPTLGSVDNRNVTAVCYLHTTRGIYVPGSTLSHLHQRYAMSNEDFMMPPGLAHSGSIERLNRKYGGPAKPFGRASLMIMGTMGYEINENIEEALDASGLWLDFDPNGELNFGSGAPLMAMSAAGLVGGLVSVGISLVL